MASSTKPLEVVIAGGGVAALEAAMALRAYAAPDRIALTLVSPEPQFSYRPLSVREPFALGAPARVPLAEVASDLGAVYLEDGLASVTPEAHTTSLTSGAEAAYDALVVAIGAARVPSLPHAISFRGQEDGDAVHGLVQDLEGGYTRRIVFVVPPGSAWSLPLYELALMTAHRVRDMSLRSVTLTLVTPEQRPLAIFGDAAGDAVGALLAQAGIEVHLSAQAEVPAHGRVLVHPGRRMIECDRIVALAATAPRPVAGLPTDRDGFVPTDEHGRVARAADVYAAGDGTSFPVKQGGIACQQADAVAETIAVEAGALEEAKPFRPVLRGQLLTGEHPRYLRTDLAAGEAKVSESTLWWPPHKVAGTYLAPYLSAREQGLPAGEQVGVARERVMLTPARGEEVELIGFERYTR